MSSQKKYIQSWVEKKGNKKWIKYFAVLRKARLFFLTSEDTHNTKHIAGHLDITGPDIADIDELYSKKKAFSFCIAGATSEFFIRVPTDELRKQWMLALQECGRDVERFNNPTGAGTLSFHKGRSSNPPPSTSLSSPQPPQPRSPHQPSPNNVGIRPLPTIPDYSGSISSVSSNDSSWRIPNDNHPCSPFGWFFGTTPREKSEELLTRHGSEGAFFLRSSESTPGNYTLTALEEGVPTHYRVSATEGGFLLTGADQVFGNLPELVQYYSTLTNGIPLDKLQVAKMDSAFSGTSTVDANAVLPGMLMAMEMEQEARQFDEDRRARQQQR